MKIVQSYWSLPSNGIDYLDEHGRSNGGWTHYKYNLMSWTLSCLKLREFYDEVELVTDKSGKNLLINQIGLPYTSCNICLDDINHYNPKLWALGKIHAYRLQKKSFLHVDGDIYIWNKFESNLEQSSLVVQNIEYDYPWYREILTDILSKFTYIPKSISRNFNFNEPLRSVCAGIIGGNDIDFFQEYTEEALRFVNKNSKYLSKINIGLFNTVFEQYLFYCMSDLKQKCISPFLSMKEYSKFPSIMSFNLAPFTNKYIHIAGSAKKDLFACEQLELRLFHEYPEYYWKIIELSGESIAENRKMITAKYENRFRKIFDKIYSPDTHEFLNTKLVLNNHAKIKKSRTNQVEALVYNHAITGQLIKHQLTEFDFILNYFHKPCTANFILNDLSDSGMDISDDIKSKIIDYLSDKLVYHRILEIA